MTHSTPAVEMIPPVIITHSTISLRGTIDAAPSVYHARTTDARMSLALNGTMLTFYNAAAVQGLLEAFAAARGHAALLPAALPPVPVTHSDGGLRAALCIEWTRRTNYAVMAQAATNRIKTATIHWVDLYTGSITWQIRDQLALTTTTETLNRLHKTAIAVFLDGETHAADPTSDHYRAA